MIVFLDSCVILSRLPREIIITLAKAKHFRLSYSRSVEEECRFVAKQKGIEIDIAAAFVELRLLSIPVETEILVNVTLPDHNDLHVLSGAIKAKAEILLTENLRDFPQYILKGFGLNALAPDQFFCQYFPKEIAELQKYSKSELKRAKLYRSAKLWAAQVEKDST